MRALARRILTSEKADGTAAIIKVCNKLRLQLSEIFGVVGFRALLHRALVLTRTETNCFERVSLDEEGTMLGLVEADSPEEKALIRDGSVLLVTNLLVLLEVFIGEALTQALLDETWPASKPKVLISRIQIP